MNAKLVYFTGKSKKIEHLKTMSLEEVQSMEEYDDDKNGNLWVSITLRGKIKKEGDNEKRD